MYPCQHPHTPHTRSIPRFPEISYPGSFFCTADKSGNMDSIFLDEFHREGRRDFFWSLSPWWPPTISEVVVGIETWRYPRSDDIMSDTSVEGSPREQELYLRRLEADCDHSERDGRHENVQFRTEFRRSFSSDTRAIFWELPDCHAFREHACPLSSPHSLSSRWW